MESPSAMAVANRPTYVTRSLLVVDCGSVFTKVALLGIVEDQYRLIARSQAPTTLAPPQPDLATGARDAISTIERIVGRQLLRDGQLITPEQADGSGVDGLTLVTSVGGPMKLLVAGPGREALAGFMYRSIGGLFTQVESLPSVRPDTAGQSPEWHQALLQVQALHPHALLVFGAPFGTAHLQANIEETGKTIRIGLIPYLLQALPLRDPADDFPSSLLVAPTMHQSSSRRLANAGRKCSQLKLFPPRP